MLHFTGDCPVIVAVAIISTSEPLGSTLVRRPGTKVDWACQDGHQLDGASSTVCQTDGTWSNPKPTCDFGKSKGCKG